MSPTLSDDEFSALINVCKKVYHAEENVKALEHLSSQTQVSQERNIHHVIATAALRITGPLKQWIKSLLGSESASKLLIYVAFVTVFTRVSVPVKILTEKGPASPLYFC